MVDELPGNRWKLGPFLATGVTGYVLYLNFGKQNKVRNAPVVIILQQEQWSR